MSPKDFNNLKQWILPRLDKKQLTVEEFSTAAGLSRASVYNYLVDRSRPTEQTMAKMCHVLGESLEAGLAQYTPKQNGRPVGSVSGPREVTVRER